MNGYYKGWRSYAQTTDHYRQANMPLIPARTGSEYFSIQGYVPSAIRNGGGIVTTCEFDRHSVTGGVYDLQIQQVLESVNEKRAAIAIYGPHPNYTDAQWGKPSLDTDASWASLNAGLWRPLKWYDITHSSTGSLLTNAALILDRLRWFITRTNSTFPTTGATTEDTFLSAWFIGETDRDVWEPLRKRETLIKAAQYYGYSVGKNGSPADGWTIIPGTTYAATFALAIQLLGTYPFVRYANHLNELMYALKMMVYLYPALGFDRVGYSHWTTVEGGDVDYGVSSDAAWQPVFSACYETLDPYSDDAIESPANPGFVLWTLSVPGGLFISGSDENPKVKWVFGADSSPAQPLLDYEVPLRKYSGLWDFYLTKVDDVTVAQPSWHNNLGFDGKPTATPHLFYNSQDGHVDSVVQMPNAVWEFTAARRFIQFDYN